MTGAVFGMSLCACEQDHSGVDSYAADLAFWLKCEPGHVPDDGPIEKFLKQNGFKVLNKPQLAKDMHVEYLFTMDIVAIDSARRQIDFMMPELDNKDSVSVALYSPPPTHRATELEGNLLGFASGLPGCKTEQVERFQNPAEARRFYDDIFARTEGWFKEADEMRRTGKPIF